MRGLALIATLILLVGTAAPGAAAASGAGSTDIAENELVEPAPQTSLADIEDEVMCPICGTLLQLSESPQAQRQRAFVAGLVAAGRTKAEIKDALVTEYGRTVLAVPGGSGFDLSAYLVPAIALLAAVVGLAVGVGRWRRAGDRTRKPQRREGPRGEDADRLEKDLARYDL